MKGWAQNLTKGLAKSGVGGDATIALKTYLLKGKERQKKYAEYGKGDISSTEPIYKLNRNTSDLFFMIMFVYLVGFAIFSGFYALATKSDFGTLLQTCFDDVYNGKYPGNAYHSEPLDCSVTRTNLGAATSTTINPAEYFPLGFYFVQSVDVFALMAILCTYIGFIWIAALGCMPGKIVKGTIYAIPSVIIAAGIFMFAISTEITWLTGIIGTITLLVGAGGFLIVKNCLGNSMDKTIRLFEYSLEILDDTPYLYVTSFGGIAIQFIFGTLFVAFFGFGLAHGDFIPVSTGENECDCVWENSAMIPKYMTYMIIMFLWIMSFVLTVCNATIGGSAAQYYYSTQTERDAIQEDRTMTSFRHAFKHQLGSLALGAMISNVLIMLAEYFSGLKEAIRKREGGSAIGKFFKGFLRCVFYVIINILDRCLRYINYFSIYYVATRAEGFCESAKKSYGIMSRAQLSPYGVHKFTSVFIFITTNIIAFFFGWMAFIWTSNRTAHTNVGNGPSIVGFIFTYLLVNMIFAMFSNIMISLVDSLCFCYAIQNEIKTNEAAPHFSSDDKLHQDVAEIFDDLRIKEVDQDDSDDE